MTIRTTILNPGQCHAAALVLDEEWRVLRATDSLDRMVCQGAAPRFIGLENYRALALDDPQFRFALRNTIVFAMITVPVTTVAAFLLAVALHAPWFRGRALARTVFFLPR